MSSIQDRITLSSDTSLKGRVAHAILESGKTLDVAKTVAAIVLSTDGVLPTDAQILDYIGDL